MHIQDGPDFGALATEDINRSDQLSLPVTEMKRFTEILNRWLKILYGEARKEFNIDGSPAHPTAGIEIVAGDDVRRIVTVQFGESVKKELLAQIWIAISGARPEVTHEFHGSGHPKGVSIAF